MLKCNQQTRTRLETPGICSQDLCLTWQQLHAMITWPGIAVAGLLFLGAIPAQLILKLLVRILDMRKHPGKGPVLEPVGEHFLPEVGQFSFQVQRILHKLFVLVLVKVDVGVSGIDHQSFFGRKVKSGICDDFIYDQKNVIPRLPDFYGFVQCVQHVHENLMLLVYF